LHEVHAGSVDENCVFDSTDALDRSRIRIYLDGHGSLPLHNDLPDFIQSSQHVWFLELAHNKDGMKFGLALRESFQTEDRVFRRFGYFEATIENCATTFLAEDAPKQAIVII
jgi:hypothetical protein